MCPSCGNIPFFSALYDKERTIVSCLSCVLQPVTASFHLTQDDQAVDAERKEEERAAHAPLSDFAAAHPVHNAEDEPPLTLEAVKEMLGAKPHAMVWCIRILDEQLEFVSCALHLASVRCHMFCIDTFCYGAGSVLPLVSFCVGCRDVQERV